MKLAWTTYTGDPATLPPTYERVLVLVGDYKDLAVLYRPMESGSPPFWHSGQGYTRDLEVGQRWLRWPAPEIMEAVGDAVKGLREVRVLTENAAEPGRALTEVRRIAAERLDALDAVGTAGGRN
ncbi:hypothetical protein [Fundidesulfovibrio butyratiphilus]